MAEGVAGHRLAEVLACLSLATDLGLGVPLERGLRTSLVAGRIADLAGLGPAERVNVYYASLLVMLGCTSTASDTAAVFGDELALGEALGPLVMGPPAAMAGWMVRNLGAGENPLRRAGLVATAMARGPALQKTGNADHCEVARLLAERLGVGPDVSALLEFAFERWDGKGGPAGVKGEAIPIEARVGAVAYDVAAQGGLGIPADAVVQRLRRHSGHGLDPALTELACANLPGLLDVMSLPSAWQAVIDTEPEPRRVIDDAGLERAAEVIADFADFKSPYTRGHSRGVAQLAVTAATALGLPARDVVTLRRAALVHDLGRVAVPAALWNHTGTFTDAQWEQVRLHAHWSERVLCRMPGLAEAGRLAGLHHERLDGSGYHRGTGGAALGPAARILAAADACRGLMDHRPHRPGRSLEESALILADEVRAGRIDRAAAEAVGTAAGMVVRRARRCRPTSPIASSKW